MNLGQAASTVMACNKSNIKVKKRYQKQKQKREEEHDWPNSTIFHASVGYKDLKTTGTSRKRQSLVSCN